MTNPIARPFFGFKALLCLIFLLGSVLATQNSWAEADDQSLDADQAKQILDARNRSLGASESEGNTAQSHETASNQNQLSQWVQESLVAVQSDVSLWQGKNVEIFDTVSAYQVTYLAYIIQESLEQPDVSDKAMSRKFSLLYDQYISWLNEEIHARQSRRAYNKKDVQHLSTRLFIELIRTSVATTPNQEKWAQMALNTFKTEFEKGPGDRPATGTEVIIGAIGISSFPLLLVDFHYDILANTALTPEMVLTAGVVSYATFLTGHYGESILRHLMTGHKQRAALKEVQEMVKSSAQSSQCKILFLNEG